MILSVDLGTTVTKVALWEGNRLVATGRSRLSTSYGPGGRAEQAPEQWWDSIRDACDSALTSAASRRTIDAIGFSAARQSFVPVASDGRAIGPGLLWSDRRAHEEAQSLSKRLGGNEELRRRTGIHLDPGAVMAKVAWLARHEPGRLERARWLLAPRDLVVWRMTGRVATDQTLASATGLYDFDGALVYDMSDELASMRRAPSALGDFLPEICEPSCVIGKLLAEPARELGLDAGTAVVIGAGDRACEVLGSASSSSYPMVSWGTTANVSVPTDTRPEPLPKGLALTRAATDGWLMEGGLSAAGSLLDWIAAVVSQDVASLVESARESPPGASGVLVTPWLGGARAPWWRDASASIIGVRSDTDVGDIARAAFEGVAFDVARCIASAYTFRDGQVDASPDGLALAAGSDNDVWVDVLTGVTGLPALRRLHADAAGIGAATLAGSVLGMDLDIEKLNPVVSLVEASPEVVERYGALRGVADEVASSMISLRAFQADKD